MVLVEDSESAKFINIDMENPSDEMWMNIHNIKQRKEAFYKYFIKDDDEEDEIMDGRQREVLPTAHFLESEVEDYN